ncbi:acyltransferase family protein [Pseudocitrobacter faecalis]|uniref:acyltransferase family protein n=1 Tax=Pseudocitrobacter faecalis TaxID=1398493 RepID=UPI001672850E|nr:acyltransferase [Pseudocitrobacter faecalis]
MSKDMSFNFVTVNQIESVKPRIHGPDILRGLAAISVIFFHVIYLTDVPYSSVYFWITGRFDFFVRVFFMISAFSMAYVYSNNINTIRDIKIFYLKRAFRIIPLFYFVIILNFILLNITSNKPSSLDDIILNSLFVFSLIPGKHASLIGGGWSIGIEMIFYLLFPFFLVIASNLRSAIISFILLLIVSIITTKYYSIYLDGRLNNFGKLNILAHTQYFIMGFIVYHAWIKYNATINKTLSGILFILSLIVMVLLFRLQKTIPEEVFISIAGASMLYFSVLGLPKLLDNKATRYLGAISYSAYLMQFPVITIFSWLGVYKHLKSYANPIIDVNFLAGVITIISVITVSSLTYKFIERPFRYLGKVVSA